MKKKIFKYIKLTLTILAFAFIGFIIAINVYMVISSNINKDKIPSIFGYKMMIVVNDSMDKVIKKDDLVFVYEQKVENIKINDVIAFKDKDGFVTSHRVIATTVEDGETFYITKGDNNNSVDELKISYNRIEGTYSSRIPYLGGLILFFQSPAGLITLIMFVITVFVFLTMDTYRKENRLLKTQNIVIKR